MIGPKTISKLLNAFGSVNCIKKATYKELSVHVGKEKGKIVQRFFEEND